MASITWSFMESICPLKRSSPTAKMCCSASSRAGLTLGRLVLPRCYEAGYGEYPAQNLWAKWEQLFRRFAPPNLGQRHFPLYEASLLSMRTIEAPFIRFLFFLLFSCGKTRVSFSFQLRRSQRSRSRPRGRAVPLRISPEKQAVQSHRNAT